MKKLLLILSLVASAASISAVGSDSGSDSLGATRRTVASAETNSDDDTLNASELDLGDTTPDKPRRFQAVKDKYAKTTKAVKESGTVKFFTVKHPVASKRAGYVVVGAVVIVAAKKAYDRYKVWKNKKAAKTADQEVVTA